MAQSASISQSGQHVGHHDKIQHDKSIIKVTEKSAPVGQLGQKYLAAGIKMGMRLMEVQPGGEKITSTRDYECIGYVISGKAKLHLEGQIILLEQGDSWVVPAGATHHYEILEPLRAIECTSPPAFIKGRDQLPQGAPSSTSGASASGWTAGTEAPYH